MPRRWSAEVDGIRWLPRMIDKARMSASGVLGAYLIGHSPIDRGLLGRLKISTADFVRLAVAEPTDVAVLAALRARGCDEAAVRRWSGRLEKQWGFFIAVLDLDEGYTPPRGIVAPLIAIMKWCEGPLAGLFRRIARQP